MGGIAMMRRRLFQCSLFTLVACLLLGPMLAAGDDSQGISARCDFAPPEFSEDLNYVITGCKF
jgi:hypothetical protein